MLLRQRKISLLVLLFEQLGDLRQRLARHNKAGGQVGDNRLPAQRQPVAVHRNQGDAGVLDVEQRTGVHRLGVGGRDGKQRLVDHRLEHALFEYQIRLLLKVWQLRIFLRVESRDGKFRSTAADGCQIPLIREDADRLRRDAANDVQQQSG